MVGRIVAVILLLASIASGQADRFEHGDVVAWARISQVSTDFEEFDLTSDQLDQLLENNVRHVRRIYRNNVDGSEDAREHARAYLNKIYEVFDERQQARLHQIMFQQWLNHDDVITALLTFAPNEVSDLKSKAEKLQEQVSGRLNEVIGELPEDRHEHFRPLGDFLVWRFESQRKWLESELGKKRVEELIGEPIAIGYRFVTKGDPKLAGFVDANAGGMWFNPGLRESRSHKGVRSLTAVINPSTGELPALLRPGNVLPRPVDVPAGLTLENAVNRQELLKRRIEQTMDEGAIAIEELRYVSGDAPPREEEQRQSDMQKSRELEEVYKEQIALLTVKHGKARAVVAKLGGDPEAESKRNHAAQRQFEQRVLACNQQPFLSHIHATAAQCDRLDEIWARHCVMIEERKTDDVDRYYAEVSAVLNNDQKRLARQQSFRRLWYSMDCEDAFARAGLTATSAQKVGMAELSKQLQGTRTGVRRNQVALRQQRHYFDWADSRFDLGGPGNEEYVTLKEQFDAALEDFVGPERARDLLGEPMEYDPNWKRPVVVPAGLAMAEATARYEQLNAQFNELGDEYARLEDRLQYNWPELKRIDKEMTVKFAKLAQQILVAKRLVEELGGSVLPR